ncbi:hypothetical protein Vadar_025702 [Vaccinium darrowii]|uniref:Uncharacterized protein n=1 Tax=Vaccinium darrowii TaxID=229202 RepID=A0ACB7Y8S4_9ERIC|nr:hypothetical protein Vadar_025702 [Vaccinium darrowii]
MDLLGLMIATSINIGLCVVLFSFYAILRKQPGNTCLYFGRRRAQLWSKGRDRKLVPRWISEARQASDEQMLAKGGLDAVVFLRMITFSSLMGLNCHDVEV